MSNPNVLLPLPNEDQRGPRLEIDEFLQNNEMTNLFMIAFSNLQTGSLVKTDKGEPNWLKFHAIAGIHGQPDEAWGGVPKTKVQTSNGVRIGYCRHSSNTFPTWHRPYMCLMEQSLYTEMARIAELYTADSDKKLYRDAAAKFRLPYWDLIMPRREKSGRVDTVWGFPQIFKNKQVFVKLPQPTKETTSDGWNKIDNPLYSYRFPTKDDYRLSGRPTIPQDPRFYNAEQTSRIPKDDGLPNDEYCDLAIQRQAAARATMLWQMLNPDITADKDISDRPTGTPVKVNDAKTWNQFANNSSNKVTVGNRVFAMPSLESWHDGIHVMLGTGQFHDPTRKFSGRGVGSDEPRRGGQMGNASIAAFDPIFFLHHCNIDRLLALFQAIFPDKYCDPEDGESQLLPFLNGKSDKSCYKSNDAWVKDYWRAGFAVPGNKQPDKNANPEAVKKTLIEYLTSTYYWATNGADPKTTLKDWPKPLAGSWALLGPDAVVAEKPVQQRTSMRMRAHVPQLVAQEITVPIVAPLAEPVFFEVAIEPEAVLGVADAVNFSLPAGALIDLEKPEIVTAQVTWNAKVKIRKYAFDGSFSVHLFTGYVKDEQPERYMTKKNEVGFTGVFTRPRSDIEGCPNCEQQRANDLFVEDVVPMTTLLYDYLESDPHSAELIRDGQYRTIRDLTPESVVPFLKEQLQWRIIDLSATLLSGQEQQAGLEITVSSRQYTPPTADNIMGVYGPETVYPEDRKSVV